MAVAVVLDAVAAARDLAHERRDARRLAADAEEARLARRGDRADRAARGVAAGSGPSSKVSAISPRRAEACGRRVRFGPSAALRGIMPATPSAAWLATSAAPMYGQDSGSSASGREPADVEGGREPESPVQAASGRPPASRRFVSQTRYRMARRSFLLPTTRTGWTCYHLHPSTLFYIPAPESRTSGVWSILCNLLHASLRC